jgi:hypothetical protein
MFPHNFKKMPPFPRASLGGEQSMMQGTTKNLRHALTTTPNESHGQEILLLGVKEIPNFILCWQQ